MDDPFATVGSSAGNQEPSIAADTEVEHLRAILHHLDALEQIGPEAKARVLAFVGSLHGKTPAKRGRPKGS